MANFGQLILTNLGIQAQYKAQAGESLKFKRIGMGSGKYTGNIMALTKLVNENVSVAISKGYTQNNAFNIEGFFSNEDLTTGFAWREIGVFVEDSSGNEVLYCYANAGDSYDFIPATADERYSKYIRVAIAVGNATNVSIVENEGFIYVNMEAFNAAVEEFSTQISQLWPSKEASGSAVQLENAANLPLIGLNIYGKSTQDGTPTPDAPVEIVSIGESGSLKVGVYGRNLVNVADVTIDNFTGHHSPIPLGFEVVVGQTYTISMDIESTVEPFITSVGLGSEAEYYLDAGYGNSQNNGRAVITFTPTKKQVANGAYLHIRAPRYSDSTTFSATVSNIKLEIGSVATEYEPCTEQTLICSTPNGLCGIPVSNGGNYTDENGQQWICDEIDFERGVYVQRVFKEERTFTYDEINNRYSTTITHAANAKCADGNGIPVLCDILEFNPLAGTGVPVVNGIRGATTSPKYVIAYYNGEVIDTATVYYPLADPIETALPYSQIAAYRALTAYSPNTTVLNNGGAEMLVKFITKVMEAIFKSSSNREPVESTEYPGCYYRMVAGEKEWLNPPMVLAEVYRTTERYKGYPVYACTLKISELDYNAGKGSDIIPFTDTILDGIRPERTLCNAIQIYGHIGFDGEHIALPVFDGTDYCNLIYEPGDGGLQVNYSAGFDGAAGELTVKFCFIPY